LKTKSFSVEKVFAENGPFSNLLNISKLENAGFLQKFARKRAKNALNKFWLKKVLQC